MSKSEDNNTDTDISSPTDMKSQVQNFIDKFLGREDVDKILESSKFNEIDIENIFNTIFGDMKEYSENNVINDYVLIDLEVFEGLGNDKENSIFNFINRTNTKVGKYLLKKILGNPSDDSKMLLQRQKVIKTFCDTDKYNNLKVKLENIGKVEDELLWFWHKLNDETKYLFDMVFFKSRFLRFLNKNEFAMKMYNYYIIIFSPAYGILSPIFMFLVPFIFIKYYFKQNVSLNLYIKILKTLVTGFGGLFKMDFEEVGKENFLTFGNIVGF